MQVPPLRSHPGLRFGRDDKVNERAMQVPPLRCASVGMTRSWVNERPTTPVFLHAWCLLTRGGMYAGLRVE